MQTNCYRKGFKLKVHDLMQENYTYVLAENIGENLSSEFNPHFTPAEMLKLGIFEGKYLNDCKGEFPQEWFAEAKTSQYPNEKINCFGVKSRQPLSIWRENGWIIEPDPRGWFQWYCRYYLGRRIPEVDTKQIKRWKSFARHTGQIKANCLPGDLNCRPKQRQALLQWSYDPFI